MTERKTVRCAVYTRKSTEHNLDLEFNSLDAQREACEAYIKSQVGEGWVLIPDRYDDGGISGGSLDRPDVQRLLSDIRAGRVDIVVVYKVDRLTRSLADFAKLVELFDKHSVSFVSITQSFNTTSSMGRLTLNILLSFAQFEREVIGERVRDKVAASKAKGMWMGGNIPLGYVTVDKKLVVQPEEAETVRLVFRSYLELGSVKILLTDLQRRGIKTKRSVNSDGTVRGGAQFGVGTIPYLLGNRLYIGEISHREHVYSGNHDAILDRDLFEAVQAKLKNNACVRKLRLQAPAALLTGLLFDSAGNRMTPTHTLKKGVHYRYYLSQAVLKHLEKDRQGEVVRISASAIEETVTAFLHKHVKISGTVPDALRARIERIVVWNDKLEIRPTAEGAMKFEGQECGIPINLSRRPNRGRSEKGVAHSPVRSGCGDARDRGVLLAAIAKSRRWLRALVAGESIAGISKAEGLGERQFRLLLNLAFVAPSQVKDLMGGVEFVPTITQLTSTVPLMWATPGMN